MRLPPLAIALSAAAALGGTAAVATAQDVPPFQPEPTTPAPTTTVPAPAPPADRTAPLISVAVPRTRVGRRITSIRITMTDPDTSVAYSQVDVKRRIRLTRGGPVRDQAYDGRRWRTTTSATKYRIFPKVGARTVRFDLPLRKGLPAARYWITVKAQNDPGRSATRKVSFRTR